MNNQLETLELLISEGEQLLPHGNNTFEGYNDKMQPQYVAWRLQCLEALSSSGSFAKPALAEIEKDKRSPYFYSASVSNLLGALKGVHAILKNKSRKPPSLPSSAAQSTVNDHVFIVHDRDETLLHQAARFLEKLGLNPILLFEWPSKGRTIIEKLEHYGNVTFAVVLLTPDDVGKLASEDGQGQPRARQNVILELGYFLGRLGRENVAVLYDESVELPSDYRGVEYIPVDAGGAWKLKLAAELKSGKLPVDLNNAV